MASAAAAAAPVTGPSPAVKAILLAQEALLKVPVEERPGHVDQYNTIITMATADAQAKSMAVRLLPQFFAGIDSETQTKALNAFLDLVEDEDTAMHEQALTKLPEFAVAVPLYVPRLADVLGQVLEGCDREVQAVVNASLAKLSRVDAPAVVSRLLAVVAQGNGVSAEEAADGAPGSAAHDKVILQALDNRVLQRFRERRGVVGEPAIATAKAVLDAGRAAYDAGRTRVARALVHAAARFVEFQPPREPKAATDAAAAATDAADAAASAEAEAPRAGPAGLDKLLADAAGVVGVTAADAEGVKRVVFFLDTAKRSRPTTLESAVVSFCAAGQLEKLDEATQSAVLGVVEELARGATAEEARVLLPIVVDTVSRTCAVGADSAAAVAAIRFGAVERALLAFHHLARTVPREAGIATGFDFDAATRKRIGFTGQPQDVNGDTAIDAAKRGPFVAAFTALADHAKAFDARFAPVQDGLRRDASMHHQWAEAARGLVQARRRIDHAIVAAAARKEHAAAVAAARAAAAAAAGDDAEAAAAAADAAEAQVPAAAVPKASDVPVPAEIAAELEVATAKSKDLSDKLKHTALARDVCGSVTRLLAPLLREEPAVVPTTFEPSYRRAPKTGAPAVRTKRGRSDSNAKGGASSGKQSAGGSKSSSSSGAAAAASSGGASGRGGKKSRGSDEPKAKRPNTGSNGDKPAGGRQDRAGSKGKGGGAAAAAGGAGKAGRGGRNGGGAAAAGGKGSSSNGGGRRRRQ